MTDTSTGPRAAARARESRYRDRRRKNALWVPLGITPEQRAGLEELGLVKEGETNRHALAEAAGRVLDAAGALAGVGAALYPGADEE